MDLNLADPPPVLEIGTPIYFRGPINSESLAKFAFEVSELCIVSITSWTVTNEQVNHKLFVDINNGEHIS